MKKVILAVLMILGVNSHALQLELVWECPNNIQLFVHPNKNLGVVNHNNRYIAAKHFFDGLIESWRFKESQIDVRYNDLMYYYTSGEKTTKSSGSCFRPKEKTTKYLPKPNYTLEEIDELLKNDDLRNTLTEEERQDVITYRNTLL